MLSIFQFLSYFFWKTSYEQILFHIFDLFIFSFIRGDYSLFAFLFLIYILANIIIFVYNHMAIIWIIN